MLPFHYSAFGQPKILMEAVPSVILGGWSNRLAVLENLTWQYVDTIFNICTQMKIRATRPLVAAIRSVKRDYDIFRQAKIDEETIRKETRLTEEFEECYEADFRKLFFGLENEVGKLDLTPDYRSLVIATYQALTTFDAARVFAQRCDRKMRIEYDFHANDECMIQDSFLKLGYLLPQFAGDCYRSNLEVRKLTATILANRVNEIELTAEVNGKIISI